MSNPANPRPPRRIDIRGAKDDYYHRTIEVIVHTNECQTVSSAFTRYEALDLMSKLAAHLAALDGAQ